MKPIIGKMKIIDQKTYLYFYNYKYENIKPETNHSKNKTPIILKNEKDNLITPQNHGPKINHFRINKNAEKETTTVTNRIIENERKERKTQTYANKNIKNSQIEKSKTNYQKYLNFKPTANINNENEKNSRYECALKYKMKNDYKKPKKPENIGNYFKEEVNKEVKKYIHEDSENQAKNHPYITKVLQSMAKINKLNQQ